MQLDPSLTSGMVQQMFNEFDSNDDGVITRAEIRRILRATIKAVGKSTPK